MTPTLEQRLEHGWALIDEASTPEEAQRLTDHWLTLIERYQEEQEPMLWNSPAMHEWEPRTKADAKSTVQRVSDEPRTLQGVLRI